MVLPAPGPLPLLRPAPVTMPPSHERPPPTATAVLCVRLAAPHTQPTTSATRCSVPTVSAPTAMAEQRPAARRAHTLRALADERKRRRAAAAQARRVQKRELIDIAEATAAQDGPLTDKQQRALDGRDRELSSLGMYLCECPVWRLCFFKSHVFTPTSRTVHVSSRTWLGERVLLAQRLGGFMFHSESSASRTWNMAMRAVQRRRATPQDCPRGRRSFLLPLSP